MSIRKSKFVQSTIVKKPLLFLYIAFWSFLQDFIKDDKTYLSIKYWLLFHKKINWDNPQTFNEKLNWLKVYERNPIYTQMADKYEAKKIVASIIGENHVVPCYGVWDKAEDIDFDSLPKPYVLKCNHNSGGGMFICKDSTRFNWDVVRKDLEKGLREDHYKMSREWPYKNIPHKILAEQFLDDHSGKELSDYKWWCFDGVPHYMYRTIKSKKSDDVYENFYDMDFNPIMIDHGFPRHIPEFDKPAEFEEMKALAAKLSQGIPYVRIDFFDVEGKVYFGEFTFYDWAGLRPFRGKWDKELGKLIVLPPINNN